MHKLHLVERLTLPLLRSIHLCCHCYSLVSNNKKQQQHCQYNISAVYGEEGYKVKLG